MCNACGLYQKLHSVSGTRSKPGALDSQRGQTRKRISVQTLARGAELLPPHGSLVKAALGQVSDASEGFIEAPLRFSASTEQV